MNVKERAEAIGSFRFIEVRLMETAAYWVPLTPEMEVKVMLGRHIWDFAQHADWLGKRTFELRQPEHYTRKAHEDYVRLLDAVKASDSTSDKLSRLYTVVVTGLIRRYEAYLAATDELLDGPSVVIIGRIITDLNRQLEEARGMRAELGIAAPPSDPWAQQEVAIASVVA
jgi:hypothetical protein